MLIAFVIKIKNSIMTLLYNALFNPLLLLAAVIAIFIYSMHTVNAKHSTNYQF